MLILLLLVFLAACDSVPKEPYSWKSFEGRLSGVPIYRAKIPLDWKIVLPEGNEYFYDTKLPICTLEVDDLLITIHNFPSNRLEERIPPFLQTERWQKQFDSIEPHSLIIQPVAYAGFSGLCFEATGVIKGQKKAVIAYVMQIAKEHYGKLSLNLKNELKHKQMRSDYTIKIVGSPENVQLRKDEIVTFAESFELIEEIL